MEDAKLAAYYDSLQAAGPKGGRGGLGVGTGFRGIPKTKGQEGGGLYSRFVREGEGRHQQFDAEGKVEVKKPAPIKGGWVETPEAVAAEEAAAEAEKEEEVVEKPSKKARKESKKSKSKKAAKADTDSDASDAEEAPAYPQPLCSVTVIKDATMLTVVKEMCNGMAIVGAEGSLRKAKIESPSLGVVKVKESAPILSCLGEVRNNHCTLHVVVRREDGTLLTGQLQDGKAADTITVRVEDIKP